MNIGIDHGYYAIKTRHFSFPAGIAEYSHEPYTLQNTLEFGGKFYNIFLEYTVYKYLRPTNEPISLTDIARRFEPDNPSYLIQS